MLLQRPCPAPRKNIYIETEVEGQVACCRAKVVVCCSPVVYLRSLGWGELIFTKLRASCHKCILHNIGRRRP